MKDNYIIKFNGEQCLRSKCRRLHGKFYEKNVDCFKMKGVWRNVNNHFVYKNLDKDGEYLLKSEFNDVIVPKFGSRVKVYIIGADSKGRDVYGFSTGIPFSVVEVYNPELNDVERVRLDSFDASKYVRNEHNGIYAKKEHIDKTEDFSGFIYKKEFYNFDKIKNLYSDCKFKFKKFHKSKYSFGIELETNSGRLPVSDLYNLGLFPLRDGSINGFEYTSVPFNDVGHAIEISKTVSKYCTIDISNSFHIHIGNIPTDKEYIVKLYELLYGIQEEIYKMFPKYKSSNSELKRQVYSAKLPNLKHDTSEEYFNEIMQFMSGGNTNGSDYKGKALKHPQDPEGEHKWNVKSRYKIFNLVPMIFSESRTLESRTHEETMNPYKIAYWIMINEAIVDYADTHNFEEIYNNKVTLNNIVKSYFKEDKSKALISYIKERKDLYKDISKNDLAAYKQIADDDKKYEPKIKLF